jgi:hypothetical protein
MPNTGARSELAKAAETTPQIVTDWFAGRKTPTLEQGFGDSGITQEAAQSEVSRLAPIRGRRAEGIPRELLVRRFGDRSYKGNRSLHLKTSRETLAFDAP